MLLEQAHSTLRNLKRIQTEVLGHLHPEVDAFRILSRRCRNNVAFAFFKIAPLVCKTKSVIHKRQHEHILPFGEPASETSQEGLPIGALTLPLVWNKNTYSAKDNDSLKKDEMPRLFPAISRIISFRYRVRRYVSYGTNPNR